MSACELNYWVYFVWVPAISIESNVFLEKNKKPFALKMATHTEINDEMAATKVPNFFNFFLYHKSKKFHA